jgi:hypothetical protein
MEAKRMIMKTERMNLYKACQEYVDQKVELKKVQNMKDEAVDLEHFEEAAALFAHEKELNEKLIPMYSNLEIAIADPERIGVSPLTLFPFRRSLFEESKASVQKDRDRYYLQKISLQSGDRSILNRIRSLEYFDIENWTDFFIERKEWLEKCLQEGEHSTTDRMVMEKELRQIKRDLYTTPKHP